MYNHHGEKKREEILSWHSFITYVYTSMYWEHETHNYDGHMSTIASR